MKTLIVDDNFTNRVLLQAIMKDYGTTDIAVNGKESLEVICKAMDEGDPYDLICLDIMMPEMDGQEALKTIRASEKERGIAVGDGVKIIMTTALDDSSNIMASFREQCDAYITKPIHKAMLLDIQTIWKNR